jgi:hypothetical protein
MGIVHPGERNPNWRGGRSVASNGYVLIRVGRSHHLADVRGYAYEHRVVAEEKFQRRLMPGEQVHHKDENKENNHPDNLEILSVSEHRFEHRTIEAGKKLPHEPNDTINCECGCGESFTKYDSSNRPRRFISGHNPKPPSPNVDAIVRCLSDGPLHRLEISKRTGINQTIVGTNLSILKKLGSLRQVSRGVWGISKIETAISNVRDYEAEGFIGRRLSAMSGAIGDDPGTIWNVKVVSGGVAHGPLANGGWTATAGMSDDVRLHFGTGAYKIATGDTAIAAASALIAKFSDEFTKAISEREATILRLSKEIESLKNGIEAVSVTEETQEGDETNDE